MRKLFLAMVISGISFHSFAITKIEAEKKIQQYIGDTKNYTINICEDKNYYIGEVYLKGYENISVVRKIYVNKTTGDIIPEMSKHADFCYMIKQ